MLQQTQTSRVMVKYKEFLKRFPTLQSLAKANLGDVLKIWIGLGYNRRAKFLWLCAKEISEKHKCKFPKTLNALIALPGVGQSTAGAILNFAFNIPTPFIETNIRTVYIHYFFKDKKNVSDKALMLTIKETLPSQNSKEWFYALYDYGSYLKSNLNIDPSKQSKHYKKQSSFKGSFREKRAFVLKSLLAKELTKTEIDLQLKEKFDFIDSNEILNALLKEGLISKKGRFYLAG